MVLLTQTPLIFDGVEDAGQSHSPINIDNNDLHFRGSYCLIMPMYHICMSHSLTEIKQNTEP